MTNTNKNKDFLAEVEEIEELSPEQLQRLEALEEIRPPELHLPRRHLSFSQVEMYLRCARQYKFRYVDDVTEPPGIAMTVGSGAHKACEITHHHLVDHGEPAPTEQVMDVFSDTFEERAAEIPEVAWHSEETDRGSIKDAGMRLVKLYNNKVAPGVRPQVKQGVRGIEKRFEVNLNGVPVVGVIDLIDTNDPSGASEAEKILLQQKGKDIPEHMRTAVADLKTKSKSMPQSEVDGSLQLTLYSYVEDIPIVRFDQLLNQKTLKIKRLHSVRTRKDHLWMFEVVTQVAGAISQGVFPPCSPTAWVCNPRWCGFYSVCRGKR